MPDTTTAKAMPDTHTIMSDTSTTMPDNSTVMPDTSAAMPDTSAHMSDTSAAMPDTSAASSDDTTAATGTAERTKPVTGELVPSDLRVDLLEDTPATDTDIATEDANQGEENTENEGDTL